jgi:hypothetical protein
MRAAVLVPFHDHDARRQPCQPRVGEDRPFAALDVHLDQIEALCAREREQVSAGDADRVALLDGGAPFRVSPGGEPDRLGVIGDRGLVDPPPPVRRRGSCQQRVVLRVGLEYTAAYGVEIRRQLVPANAGEVTASLLEAGADPAARLHTYGRTFDTLAMLKSSAHPRAAGVEADIEHALATYVHAHDP